MSFLDLRTILGNYSTLGKVRDSSLPRTVLGKPVSQKEVQKRQQGQGIQGLYRGWRMGMWGIAGMWGANVLGGMAGGYEDEVTMRGGHGRSSGGRF